MPISVIENIDCMAGMKNIADNYFDLAITDPPYGINAPNMQMGNNATSRGGKTSVAVSLKNNRLQRLNSGGGKLKNTILNKSEINWDFERPSIEYFNELRR